MKLCSFNSQLHSGLSVVGHHDHGQETEKYCPLPERWFHLLSLPVNLPRLSLKPSQKTKSVLHSLWLSPCREFHWGMTHRNWLQWLTMLWLIILSHPCYDQVSTINIIINIIVFCSFVGTSDIRGFIFQWIKPSLWGMHQS